VTKFVLLLVAAVGVPMALSAPAGAATVPASQYGFTFSVPSNWTQIPLGSKDIGAIIGAAAKGGPALENVLDQQAVAATKKTAKRD
jgi:hypothetical protein